ncbi:unnamed protein product, partial [Rotaria sp. Silwood2]
IESTNLTENRTQQQTAPSSSSVLNQKSTSPTVSRSINPLSSQNQDRQQVLSYVYWIIYG